MEPVNIRELIERRSADRPDKAFLFSEIDGRELTYAEFDRAVNRAGNMLIANGIGKSDVVSLLLPNSAEYLIAYFACWKVGALAGPVNSLLKPEEIAWVVRNSEAKLVLVGSEFLPKVEPPASTGIETFPSKLTFKNIELRLPTQSGGSDMWPPIVIFDDAVKVLGEFSDDLENIELSSDDEAIVIYTSGTTGKPKGCLLTHGNIIANARQITEWMGFDTEDRLLSIMPLFHMNAVTVTTMTALYCGGSTVISPKFSASRFWDIIEKYKITSFGSVATMLSMLLQNPKSQVSSLKSINPQSLRFAMCGSAPVPAEVLRKFEETFGCLVIEGYGLSESTCRSTFNPPNENRRPGSCGMPIGNEMKIFDENDRELPDGEMGEIVLRGPNIFKAYFKNSEATEKAFAGGWFHTGDIGTRDADGFFYVADRKSDMIIRGGENIYPREIDDLLYTHPAVAAAAAVGVPNELYGEEVAAFIVLKDGVTATETEIVEFCKQHLADYKCPETVHFVEDIPKGPTGKLLKRELAKLYANIRG